MDGKCDVVQMKGLCVNRVLWRHFFHSHTLWMASQKKYIRDHTDDEV